jgi:serine/threonine protein kinase
MELGRGAMGVTYKALDTHLRFVVALKVINIAMLKDECACRRFVREARSAARVRHENVASIFHLGRQGDFYFYTMEFVEGESLDRVIRRAGRLAPTVALRIIRLAAAGLEAMASQNLVHRDIKPSNIMVSPEGDKIVQAKIIDLGLAKNVVDDDSISVISNPGSFSGTPAYASPEQFNGPGVDIRSDLYSLGVTLWEILCGELPFRGSPLELRDQHRYAPLPLEKLSQLPRPITGLLQTLLEKDPNRRFQRPAELLQAVMKTLEPEKWQVNTDGLGSVKLTTRANQLTRRWGRFTSRLRQRSNRWLLGPAIGLLGVVLAWHSLLHQVRSWLGPDEEARTEYSIAVLPFENISPNKEDTYFADGMQDEILRSLVGINELKVVSRTSLMYYRDSDRFDLKKVATALGVTNFLEGTVRRDGQHVRVTMALVDARNEHIVWVASYDRELTSIFTVQREIAQQVTAKVNARFGSAERKRK